MDILDIIKKRASTRRYEDKPIPKEIIDKIIEAGIWGPSLSGFLMIQPWKFVVIKNQSMIVSLSAILEDKAKVFPAAVSLLLKAASKIIGGAPLVVVVYNSGDVEKKKGKYKESFANFASIFPKAELCAIAAAIQNMVLVAHEQGVESCWLDMPLFCEQEINTLLGEQLCLVAVVTFGYSVELGKRSGRKEFSESTRFI